MSPSFNKILVLAFGNDIMGDSAAALIAARKLKTIFINKIDLFEASIASFALMDILEGYQKALILDSTTKQRKRIGDVFELSCEEFNKAVSSTADYAGLAELICQAKKQNLKFPSEIRILAIDIDHRHEIREGLSPHIKAKIPLFVSKATDILHQWLEKEEHELA